MAIPWQVPCYFTTGVIFMVLNSVEIFLISKKFSKRRTTKAFETFLLSLSCSDLLVGTIIVVLLIYLIALDLSNATFPKSNVWFYAFVGCFLFAFIASTFNVLAIGLDRLLAIKYPLKHRLWMCPRCAKLVVIGIWILDVAVVLARILATLMSSNTPAKVLLPPKYIYVLITGILLSSFIFIFLYSFILWTVFQKTSHGVESSQTVSQTKQKTIKNRNLAITCTLLMILFLVRSVPSATDILMTMGKVGQTLPLSMLLMTLNSMVNPVIYFYKSYMERRLSARPDSSSSVN